MIEQAPPAPARVEIDGGAGLVLRQYVVEDAQIIFDLIDFDREHLNSNYQWIADKYPTVEAVRKSIEEPKPHRLRLGTWDHDKMVGGIAIEPDEPNEEDPVPTAEIGYWIGKEHIGHGYAAKALKLMVGHAFEHMGMERLVANVVSGNTASARTLQKEGFRLESISWEVDRKTEDRIRVLHYELLKDKPEFSRPVRVDLD